MKELHVINIKRKYLGVGFIKSRKSEDKIMSLGEEMIAKAEKNNLKLLEIIVDSGSGLDVDRTKVDKLVAWMEKSYIEVIVVRSIWDITKDEDDLAAFMMKANDLGVSIYDQEQGMKLTCIPWNDECGW